MNMHEILLALNLTLAAWSPAFPAVLTHHATLSSCPAWHHDTVARQVEPGLWALPEWSASWRYDSRQVRYGRRTIWLEDRPREVVGGWALYRVAWPRGARRG